MEVWDSMEKSGLNTQVWNSSAFRRFENHKTARDRVGREEHSQTVSEEGGTPAQWWEEKPRRQCVSRSKQSSVAKRSMKRGQRRDRVIRQHGSDLDKPAPSERGKMGEECMVEIAEQLETSFFWSIIFVWLF